MDREFQPLLRLLDQLSDEFVELQDGVRKAIRIAGDDPEMALTRTRKVLEYIVHDVFRRRFNEKPGARPLENLLQRLSTDGHLPRRVSAYANAIRDLGNVGTHTFGEGVTVDDVRQSLGQLMPVVEWYVKVERPDAMKMSQSPRDSSRGTSVKSTKRLSSARGDRVRAELYIVNDKEVFSALFAQREAIERELGEVLDWKPLPERRAARISLYCDGNIENPDEQLAQIRSWVIARLMKLKSVLGPRLTEINSHRAH